MITIKTVDHKDQRYPTVGDWYRDDTGLHVVVSKMSDKRYELLVALHELVEVVLCEQRGISQQQVDDFDKSHLDSDSPGDEPDAPYRKEHEFATAIEMIMAQQLGIDWVKYVKEVESL